MTDDRERTGAAVRREILGDAHVDRPVSAFRAPFIEYVTRTAWGEVWSRPGLDRRTRSCLTLAILAALGHHHELAMHVEAAVRTGVTREEIQEVLLHTTVYAGTPAGNAAFAIAEKVLDNLADGP